MTFKGVSSRGCVPIGVHVNWIDESRIVSSPRVTHTQCSLPPCRSVKLDDRIIGLLKLVRAFDQHCVGHFQGYDVPLPPQQPRCLRADSITKFAHTRGKDPLYFMILTLAWCDHYEYFKLYASSRSYPCWQAQLNSCEPMKRPKFSDPRGDFVCPEV